MLELYFPQMIVIIRWCTPQVNIFKPSIQIQPPGAGALDYLDPSPAVQEL